MSSNSSPTAGDAKSSAADSTPSQVASEPVYQAGTLTYNKSGLRRVFAWLLSADLVFVLIDQIEPRALPIILKQFGATDTQIAFIVTSIPAFVVLLLNPIISYRSDRTRSRWGRRIPYIMWATPFVSFFLGVTPFAPELAKLCGDWPVIQWMLAHMQVSPVVFLFGVLVLIFQLSKVSVVTALFTLIRDVVPTGHLGRFMSLFRAVSAIATFALIYWLLPRVEDHAKEIFVGIAILNLLAFGALCIFVREGEYPPVVDKISNDGRPKGIWYAIRNYCSESFSSPIYWWLYGARVPVYAVHFMLGFLIFFPQHELKLGLETSARYTAWASFAWLAVAYPVGVLIDRWGAIRVFVLTLWLNFFAYVISFFLVTGKVSFFLSAISTGMLYWMVMLVQIVFLQILVHPDRLGQISSANSLLQSILLIGVVSPFVGGFLDFMKGYHAVWEIPLFGPIEVGPYRFVYLIFAMFYLVALICARKARQHWLKLGGPDNYTAPL